MPEVIQQWIERIRAAAASAIPLRLQGSGSKAFYGNPAVGELLDTRAHSGIVNYEPTELVLTARCGTTLQEIERVLAEHGQMLAFEPPHFGQAATLGGCISAGLSGPRRVAAGAVRDFVLGVEMIDGRGDLQRFGGEVMKNVAGYDVSRLVCGALGTLGLITSVSIKVLPRPMREVTVQFEMQQAPALTTLSEWSQLPLPMSASAVTDGRLRLRLSGAETAITAARRRLGGELVPDTEAERYWWAVREQTTDFFADVHADLPLWRLSVASIAPPLPICGPQFIEWHGALRWVRTKFSAEEIRIAAAAARGHATLFRGGTGAIAAFMPLPPMLMQLHTRLKRSFDPQGVFNRGRLYRDF